MSTPATNVADDSVNIVVDGVPMKARKGEMIIRVTDANDVYVPRFCYHAKLSVAANCRMCLVEVEKAPKPLPACATPVAEGMKIFTRSPKAIAAQKAVMEFLLINHPLDCPICDQGGECELQDLAMGFGRDVSRFNERKRVVKDKNLGPLVSTDMTRCIHCTRCVRFGVEVAGIQEMGTTGRGENMEIGTFIEKSVDHEMAGNIIDLCPVGALNSKPFRFRGRAWEMSQQALVSPHDGLGSNLFGHVLRGRLMRVVPRANDAINETWISDRDRFSYEGVYSDDRLETPMVRENGKWREVDWQTALAAAAEGLRRASPARTGFLASPSSTVEELYLVNRIARSLGSGNIDHRLRQLDFGGAASDPLQPALGMPIAEVDALESLFVVGSNLRAEVPVLASRVRKAALRGGRIAFLNPATFPYLFPVAGYVEASPAQQLTELMAILAAVSEPAAKALPREIRVEDRHRDIAAVLMHGSRRAIWLGALAIRHPAYASIRALAAKLAEVTGASLGILAEGSNAAGAHLAGVLPHRAAAGTAVSTPGLDARAMLEQPMQAYLLLGVEPGADSLVASAVSALASAELVVAITPFVSEELKQVAHVLLPAGTFAETSGTYVSLEGRWQSFTGAAQPVGQARPAWKVLRVLGNLLEVAHCEYQSSEEVREELRALVEGRPVESGLRPNGHAETGKASIAGQGVIDVPMYQIDALVRRAPSLQRTRVGREGTHIYGVEPR